MSNDLPDRQTVRLKGFDYTSRGYYFITICTHNRENSFGEIINGKMILNNTGKIVDYWWNEIPKHFPGVELDEYQIMPNHFHGIPIVGAGFPRPIPQNTRSILLNGLGNPTPTLKPTLGQILAYFKYQSAKSIRLNTGGGNNITGAETAPLQNKYVYIKKIWQRNFYEHIIRNEKEYFAIREYIKNNPKNWEKDTENVGVGFPDPFVIPPKAGSISIGRGDRAPT